MGCLCPRCREPTVLPPAALQKAGLDRIRDGGELQLFTARGCAQCKQTGYRGRTSIHELFVMDAAAHQAILDGADATTLHQVARRGGMLTLYEDGLRKVAAGITSLEELLRVTQDQSGA